MKASLQVRDCFVDNVKLSSDWTTSYPSSYCSLPRFWSSSILKTIKLGRKIKRPTPFCNEENENEKRLNCLLTLNQIFIMLAVLRRSVKRVSGYISEAGAQTAQFQGRSAGSSLCNAVSDLTGPGIYRNLRLPPPISTSSSTMLTKILTCFQHAACFLLATSSDYDLMKIYRPTNHFLINLVPGVRFTAR